jgi:DNA mismatch endonuclease (patch repair protein)
MADVFTKKKRSEVMSRIRGRGNKDTELALMQIFREYQITGWRRHSLVSVLIPKPREKQQRTRKASLQDATRKENGGLFRVRPDFVFSKLKLAVFVDGCFWHGCPQHSSKPKTNATFWQKKLVANKARDRLVTRVLRKKGWKVLRIWEHDLTYKHHLNLLLRIKKIGRLSSPRKRRTR